MTNWIKTKKEKEVANQQQRSASSRRWWDGDFDCPSGEWRLPT